MPLPSLAIALIVLTLPATRAVAQTRYVDGVFVRTAEGVTELIAYAEPTHGRLRMAHGDLEQAPVVFELQGILSSLPHWRPIGVFVGTSALFEDERAERRQLPIAVRMMNVYAVEVRAATLERREELIPWLAAVRASADSPGYAFVVLRMESLTRYYPIRLTPLDQ
jgi:hypothetical protein